MAKNTGLTFSEVDSARFGIRIFRGVLLDANISEIKRCIDEENPDILIVRLSVSTVEQHHLLNTLGHEWILADTLVYYHADLQKHPISPLKNQLDFVPVTEKNEQVLTDIVPRIFINYTNHYFSNPFLDKSKITEGYIQWATGYLNNKNPDRYAWLVYKGDEAIGFATCEKNDQLNDCEGILYGVDPAFAGGGVYSDMIRYTQTFFAQKGVPVMRVSTQIQNFAVQKVWTREGFSIKEAYYTYHINIRK